MAKQYCSRLLASIHETAKGLHAAGVMGKQTLHEFDALCSAPVHSLTPEQIRSLRLREGASQHARNRNLR